MTWYVVVTSGGSGGGDFMGLLRMDHLDLIWSRVELGLGCFGCFFHFCLDLYGLRERQFLFFLTEHGLQDGFIVDGADEQFRIPSSSELLMNGKSLVVAICRTLASNSVDITPGFLLMGLQNWSQKLEMGAFGALVP